MILENGNGRLPIGQQLVGIEHRQLIPSLHAPSTLVDAFMYPVGSFQFGLLVPDLSESEGGAWDPSVSVIIATPACQSLPRPVLPA